MLILACLAPAALCLPTDRLAFVPAYLFGVGGFDGPINLFIGLRGLFSYFLVHDGAAHLFANAAALGVFGAAAAARLGDGRLAGLFFAAAVFAALAEGAAAADRLTPLVGASGGISGLMGASAVLAPRLRLRFRLIPLPRTGSLVLMWLLGVDLAINLGLAALSLSQLAPLLENVAWRAHLAGFAFGLVAGLWLRRRAEVCPDQIEATHGFALSAGWRMNGLTAVVWTAALAAALRGC